jgi:hypothetical protein
MASLMTRHSTQWTSGFFTVRPLPICRTGRFGPFPFASFVFSNLSITACFLRLERRLFLPLFLTGRNEAFSSWALSSWRTILRSGLFYLWPSQGPYYLCPGHFLQFPSTLKTYAIQKFLIGDVLALWNHVPIRRISTDYFIAFPCMHIAQPLIVAWFLRRWKRMLLVLFVYDAVLIVSILLLEWHYVVDIIGGHCGRGDCNRDHGSRRDRSGAGCGAFRVKTLRSWLWPLLAVLCGVSMWTYADCVLIPYQKAFAFSHDRPRGNLSDLYPRWLGARELLLHGRDPYSAEVTSEIQAGYYGRPLDASRPYDPRDQAGFAYPVYVAFSAWRRPIANAFC